MTGHAETVIWVAAFVGALATIVGAVAMTSRFAWRLVTGLSRFLDDWNGEPKRAGDPGRPGVLERIGTLEDSVNDLKRQVTDLEHETTRRTT